MIKVQLQFRLLKSKDCLSHRDPGVAVGSFEPPQGTGRARHRLPPGESRSPWPCRPSPLVHVAIPAASPLRGCPERLRLRLPEENAAVLWPSGPSPPLHGGFALPEAGLHPGHAVGAGQVDVVFAALEAAVMAGHVERVGPALRLLLSGTGLPQVVPAGASPASLGKVGRPPTAVAAFRVAGHRLPILGGPWPHTTTADGAVPATVVALGVAVVEAPALAGGMLRGGAPQHFQAVVLPIPAGFSSAPVVPAAVEVAGVPAGTGDLAISGVRLRAGSRVGICLALGYLQIGELAAAPGRAGAAGRGGGGGSGVSCLWVAADEDLRAVLRHQPRVDICLHGQCVPVGGAAGEPGVEDVPAPDAVVNKNEESQHHGGDAVEAAEDDVQVPALGHGHGAERPQGDVQGVGDHQCPELHLQRVDAIRLGAGRP